MTRSLPYAAFFVGLFTIGWVGVGYVGTNPLALVITLLIGAFYLMGALELKRFHEATATLARAVSGSAEPPPSLGQWLAPLHPSLQNAVRLRVEGERVGLPGPALTPYLAGLLVLLGMLGTFLGMVVTLNGTGAALQSASDLESIRSSLAAPVKGLGLAFGTSVAGVAASAMLGLVSALCRRDRLQAALALDTKIATTLRVFSLAHQREESFRLLQRQGDAMPELVDRLQLMLATMERQSQALNERLIASQDSFHSKAEAAYAGLASSVGRSLGESLTESARMAGATIQPVVEATMAGIAREAGALHHTLAQSVQQQLDGLSSRFETLTHDSRGALEHVAETFDQRSGALVERISARLDTAADSMSARWQAALAEQERAGQAISRDTQAALTAAAATFEQHSAALLHGVGEAHATQQSETAAREQQRLAAWTASLEAMSRSLQHEWQEAGARTERQGEAICHTLAETARGISAQTEAQARNTLAEIAQLMQTAAEAPRAAAEVIAELRQKLSDSMVRDNAMLDERGRILATLETLLEGVNHASTEQRAAIDGLLGASADLLERVGTRFTDKVDAESARMADVAAQLTGSAAEVASLGEAFGFGVQLFSQSNDKLVTHLQRIEGALGKSIARSDEQLDYYVAQAREVIDLSIMSQKQIVEDLQRLADTRVAAGSET